jgi:hypothetical protein
MKYVIRVGDTYHVGETMRAYPAAQRDVDWGVNSHRSTGLYEYEMTTDRAKAHAYDRTSAIGYVAGLLERMDKGCIKPLDIQLICASDPA